MDVQSHKKEIIDTCKRCGIELNYFARSILAGSPGAKIHSYTNRTNEEN